MDTQQEIAEKFISDFKVRFQSSQTLSRDFSRIRMNARISQSDNQALTKILDLQEVKEALFAMDANKTPGPDGFGAGFFQRYWEYVKVDLF